MWCRVIQKDISDITESEVENKCVVPLLDCSNCCYLTAIVGSKLTEQEQEKVNAKIRERKAKIRMKKTIWRIYQNLWFLSVCAYIIFMHFQIKIPFFQQTRYALPAAILIAVITLPMVIMNIKKFTQMRGCTRDE